MKEDLELRAADGVAITATYYAPTRSNGVAAVINGAAGVPRHYYAAFAGHLNNHGIAVLTYDYRGAEGTVEDWGRCDQVAAINFMRTRRPRDAVCIIGHSMGGQILGLAENIDLVRAAFFVCVQHGHWRHWPWPMCARMWFLWHVWIPGLTRVFGRFPGSWFGTADLPASIARSWARWGRSPHYVCDTQGRALRPYNALVRIPIRWISFTDDGYGPLSAVEALRDYYPAARQERLHLAPSDLGLSRVGHFGYLRRSMPTKYWDEAATWLIDQVRAADARA